MVTITAPNYMAHVRVLAQSWRRFHAEIPFYGVIVSPAAVPRPFGEPPVRWLALADLRVPRLRSLLLAYGPKELCAALKPVVLRFLLDRGHRSVLFLDPDMLVLAALDDCLALVCQHALTLTPHLLPFQLGRTSPALERELVMVGTFNAGFVGVSEDPEARGFLEWWERRLRTHCREDLAGGLHYDQRWLDLAPGLVGDFRLLSDPGINLGHWRLPALAIEERDGVFFAEGRQVRLFHFSGYDPLRSEEVTRFRPGWHVGQTGPLARLFRHYAALLLEAGWDQWRLAGWELPPRLRLLQEARRALLHARVVLPLMLAPARQLLLAGGQRSPVAGRAESPLRTSAGLSG